jgi:ligand-binding SRPBCC domain-containing protein
MYYELTDHFEVGAPIDEAWRFFSTADNLPLITPPWLRFKTAMTGPVKIELNSNLDYTIRWMGLPIKWRTKIIDWSPPRQFIDLQVRGPYALWHHLHRFEPAKSGGVICWDRVVYQLPIFGVRRVVHPLVKNQLMQIFRFRREAIRKHLGGLRPLQDDVEIGPLT